MGSHRGPQAWGPQVLLAPLALSLVVSKVQLVLHRLQVLWGLPWARPLCHRVGL